MKRDKMGMRVGVAQNSSQSFLSSFARSARFVRSDGSPDRDRPPHRELPRAVFGERAMQVTSQLSFCGGPEMVNLLVSAG